MKHISQIIHNVIGNIEKKGFSGAPKTFERFHESLAGKERRHIKCVGLRDGVLTVNVDSSAWLYQLTLKKEHLIGKLGLKNIRFYIGDIK